jgi:type IV pilus assembly protein PilW
MGVPAMIRVRLPIPARRRMAGLSLIEMMIALVMALIVAAGIITVFQSTSSSNRVQAQLASLQEAGRFAIQSLRNDLANANSNYCSNTGGNASATGSGIFLDSLRSPLMYAKANLTDTGVAGHFADITTPLPDPTQAYSLPSAIFMRGYDCGTNSGSCTPVDPSASTDIPILGTDVGDRVPGTSVLTIRYLKPGSGWEIAPGGSSIDVGASPITITLNPLPGEDPATDFTGSFAMLADCNSAKVYSVTPGTTVTLTGDNYTQPTNFGNGKPPAPRVFDFSNDFQTITYYVKVVNAGNGHTTGALVRRVNGRDDVAGAGELVRGVERLNFSYGIIDANGNTQFLSANEVDTGTTTDGTTIPCPPGVSIDGGMGNAGCLWRAVKTIQVNVLMDGQTPLYTLTPAEMNYIYSPDGDNVPAPPASHDIKPVDDQGFPKELLRREFTTVVALRNYNP